MVTVKLYGMAFSTCTKRVWITAHEIGIDVEIIPAPLIKRAQKEPAYIENYHPFGVIPVLEDEDGTKIYESRAIARYLIAKYAQGSPLLPNNPSDVKAYGMFEQAASIEHSIFDPPAHGLAHERVFAPMKKLPSSEELAQKYIDMLMARMDGYERILSKQNYIQDLTLADLFHLPYGQILDDLEPTVFSWRPHVKAWWDNISSRECWRAAMRLHPGFTRGRVLAPASS
ncbi:Glutathione S-transferase PM239X14 [Rhizoctonia solani]|uniref:glutathione transferase n=1 Tax=Rhizoctonia solani TaxID=456999 RepID=A0A0K6FTH5_9AGAM|nr:Glutathione S-transferase PM239X14 [Rhizoctonia solani]